MKDRANAAFFRGVDQGMDALATITKCSCNEDAGRRSNFRMTTIRPASTSPFVAIADRADNANKPRDQHDCSIRRVNANETSHRIFLPTARDCRDHDDERENDEAARHEKESDADMDEVALSPGSDLEGLWL